MKMYSKYMGTTHSLTRLQILCCSVTGDYETAQKNGNDYATFQLHWQIMSYYGIYSWFFLGVPPLYHAHSPNWKLNLGCGD